MRKFVISLVFALVFSAVGAAPAFAAGGTITVSTLGSGSGTVTVGGTNCSSFPCPVLFSDNGNKSITASAANGSVFAGWSGACTGTGSCSLQAKNNPNVTATFNLIPVVQYDLSVATSGSGSGTVTGDGGGIDCTGNAGTCSASLDANTVVHLTASAADGSAFVSWSGACTGTDASSCTVTLDAAKSVTAQFDESPGDPTYLLTIQLAGTGSGTVTNNGGAVDCGPSTSSCEVLFNDGDNVELHQNADDGSSFTGWSGDGVSCPGNGACSIKITNDITVIATFDLDEGNPGNGGDGGNGGGNSDQTHRTLSLTLNGSGSGTVTSDDENIDCSYDGDSQTGSCTQAEYIGADTVVLTAAADDGSEFTGWTGNCEEEDLTGPTCTLHMSQDESVTAAFGQTTGSTVDGIVYEDENANGNQDEGDAGLAGRTVILVEDGEEGPTVRTTTTDEDGNYSFIGEGNLPDGDYTLCQELYTEWEQSQPVEENEGVGITFEGSCDGVASYYFTVSEGGITPAGPFDFGTYERGTITGFKFNDRNKNGEFDQDEDVMSSWTIQLYDADGETLLDSMKTDDNGSYIFDRLEPGTYVVREVNRSSWSQTMPGDSNGYSIELTSGDFIANQNFGNHRHTSTGGSGGNGGNGDNGSGANSDNNGNGNGGNGGSNNGGGQVAGDNTTGGNGGSNTGGNNNGNGNGGNGPTGRVLGVSTDQPQVAEGDTNSNSNGQVQGDSDTNSNSNQEPKQDPGSGWWLWFLILLIIIILLYLYWRNRNNGGAGPQV